MSCGGLEMSRLALILKGKLEKAPILDQPDKPHPAPLTGPEERQAGGLAFVLISCLLRNV